LETETWLKLRDQDRDFIKNSETRVLKSEIEISKFVYFAEFTKNMVITSKLKFF